ncbi:putative transmembrane protein [Toxoplasma gondii RUB]|uniref:Putative transmembrane protein n=2 Tax=Toxoplasma gondii TaxID=5811 RepID=A0A086LU95_TOXGO|nr:putative transmembrane protein [Toxoplasma gondii RUB]PUA87256.1 putative transmembrane protein [Toxoplasma gondii TgCATBr9]
MEEGKKEKSLSGQSNDQGVQSRLSRVSACVSNLASERRKSSGGNSLRVSLPQTRSASLRLFSLVFCCGLFAAVASVCGKLALDFHSQAPLSRLSLVLVDWLSPLPGSSSPSCFASEEEDGGAQSRDPDRGEEEQSRDPEREEERPSEGSPRTEKTGDACRGQRGEASPSVARLPSSLLSLLHAIWTNCFLGSCHAEATRASLAGDRNASTLLPSSPLSSSSASEVFSRRSNLSVSRPPSLCEGVLLLPCSLLLLLGILRVAPLLLMALSNALLLHCQFRALLESATAFVPSVLTFVFNFLLSGCFSVVVFGEAVSLRWLAGAGAMLTGVGLLMRATADEGTRKAGEKKVRKID